MQNDGAGMFSYRHEMEIPSVRAVFAGKTKETVRSGRACSMALTVAYEALVVQLLRATLSAALVNITAVFCKY